MRKVELRLFLRDFFNIGEVRPILALVGLFALSSFISPYFFTYTNISILMGMMTVTAFATLGEAMLILMGCIDLSCGSQIGLACVLTASLFQFYNFDVAMVFFTVITIIMMVGFMNGMIITKWKIPPFVVTFASMTGVRGAIYLYNSGNTPISNSFMASLNGNIGIFPIIFLIFAVIAFVFFIIFRFTKFGLYINAIGGNEIATRNLGMPVDSIKVLVYTLGSLTFAIAGIMVAVRTQSAYPLAGNGMELQAITSAVVGGYSFTGGEGTVLGGIAGAAVLSVILNIMVLSNVNTFWQWVVEGVIVVAAASVYKGRK